MIKFHYKGLFWICIVFFMVMLGSFLTYFCLAQPNDLLPKNIDVQTEGNNQSSGNSVVEKVQRITLEQKQPLFKNVQQANHSMKIDTSNIHSSSHYDETVSSKTHARSFDNATNRTECLVFYIGELTDFYELIITLLFGVIGIILIVTFLYLHLTSKRQAEEMAGEALKSDSFVIILDDVINKKVAEKINASELMETATQMMELKEQVEMIEKEYDIKSYEEIKDAKEGGDGNGNH